MTRPTSVSLTLATLGLCVLGRLIPVIMQPGSGRVALQIAVGVATVGVAALSIGLFLRWALGAGDAGAHREDASRAASKHRPRRRPVPLGRWDNPVEMGDEDRLRGAVRLAVWSSLGAVVSLVAVIIGVGDLRVYGIAGLVACLLILVPCLTAAHGARRRLASGRGLVVGDPYRPEGIDPGDPRPTDDWGAH